VRLNRLAAAERVHLLGRVVARGSAFVSVFALLLECSHALAVRAVRVGTVIRALRSKRLVQKGRQTDHKTTCDTHG
jgi:hypothetical protein